MLHADRLQLRNAFYGTSIAIGGAEISCVNVASVSVIFGLLIQMYDDGTKRVNILTLITHKNACAACRSLAAPKRFLQNVCSYSRSRDIACQCVLGWSKTVILKSAGRRRF